MKLKLQLVKNGEVLFEIPLSPADWSKDQIDNELGAFEEEFQKFSKIFDALSHETRLRMMKRLIEEEDRTLNFADFMRELDLNPKIVWENARKLREGGLLEKVDRGKYRCSDFGQRGFMLLSFSLRRLIGVLEELDNY
jgi:DNA-binding transcriptional ArsR family regulator